MILTRQPSQRFIPAYAGNSRQERPSGAKSTVHPRLRGELQIPGESSLDVYGSSPLTRGTPGADSSGCRNGRFIPAYAGNSATRVSLSTAVSVHPRLRGELLPALISWLLRFGSSPLTRGTHDKLSSMVADKRFIPAYAGNSPDAKTL